MDFESWCDGLDGDSRERELAAEAAEEAAELRSLELSHAESLIDAITEAVDGAIESLPVNAAMTFTQRQLLWSALWGFCNDVVIFDERAALRVAS
jgi:hypothetical protein